MGNDTSKPSNRMAISALAHMIQITKPQLIALRDKCISYSETGNGVDTASGYQLRREKFLDAMQDMEVAMDPDYQILEKLFILWDRNGAGWIDPLEFLAGFAPLASVMDPQTKLEFALEVYDQYQSGRIESKDLVTVLGAINTTASYLGDAVLQKNQITAIVHELYKDERMLALDDGDGIAYSGKVHKITKHPFAAEFSSGAGSARYGTSQ